MQVLKELEFDPREPELPGRAARTADEAAALLRAAGYEVAEATRPDLPAGVNVDLCLFMLDEHDIAGYDDPREAESGRPH